MQTKRFRLRAAILATLVAGLVTLTAAPAVSASALTPTLEVTPATCDLLGATDILVRAGGLVAGETYMVTVVASDRSPIDARELSGDKPTETLLFEDVPNGDSYAVSIANTAHTVGASTTVALPICDLPTLPEGTPPVSQPLIEGLAFTGTTPLLPALGGFALIQVGVVLLGVAIAWARARARDARVP